MSTLLRRSALLFLGLILLVVTGCERGTITENGSRLQLPEGVEPVGFAPGTVQVKSAAAVHTLQVEIAENDAQRERGLMYRTSMPEDAGMIFVYPTAQEGAFWMFNTQIPLSIAYADADGKIVRILDMEPCESPYASFCPLYPAGAPFQYALEVNRGYFQERGISIGDQIVLSRE